jgi:hypothetical protein
MIGHDFHRALLFIPQDMSLPFNLIKFMEPPLFITLTSSFLTFFLVVDTIVLPYFPTS